MSGSRCRKLSLTFAATALLAGCAGNAGRTAGVNWLLAGRAFFTGEGEAPMVYSRKDASRCVGRWTFHRDAVDAGGKIPADALSDFPAALRWEYAMHAAEFFGEDGINQMAYRQAADEAEAQLRRALAGDREAFRLYFDALGKCSTQPEAVGDATGDAVDAPAVE
ncbi:MAG: hypothetical protein WBO55_13200 [Rhizobiaceae bacterium]